MPGLINHVTVTFPHRSGLTEDQVVNTFTFAREAEWDAASYANLETALTTFYNVTASGEAAAVGAFLGPQLSRSIAPTFRHYDVTDSLGGSVAGSPARVQPMALLVASSGTASLPSEIAICLSFHSAYGTDVEFGVGARPRARDRGRIFLGPLNSGAVATDGTTFRPKVQASIISAFIHSARVLAADTSYGGTWVVWSRRAARVRNIVTVSVDDAFDVQRRRGEAPVVKTVWNLP